MYVALGRAGCRKQGASNICLKVWFAFSSKHGTNSRLPSIRDLEKSTLSEGWLLLFLALHAVGTGRREESTAALLASAVATILTTDRTADAVEQAREE